jgi:hypothetical protein
VAIDVVTRKLLWGHAGNECAFPGCSQALITNLGSDESQVLEDAGAVIGEEAHIRSGRQEGPRYDPTYPEDKIDGYQNLLLLCPTHHAIVDKNDGRGFSVVELVKIKRDHELLINQRIGPAGERSRELEERMFASVIVWEQKANLENWGRLTCRLTTAVPSLSITQYSSLIELGRWLLGRNWPQHRFPRISRAFDNMHTVLHDLIDHLNECGDVEEDYWQIRRDYKSIAWNPERSQELLVEFNEARWVLYSLIIELTKAVNWVIRMVTIELEPLYRFDEGMILFFMADLISGELYIRAEYDDSDFEDELPYVGLNRIRRAVKAMDGQLNWQALLNLRSTD